MVLPLPSVATPQFPSEYALSYRNWFFGLSTCIIMSALLSIFVIHNILGGFMTLIIGSLGFYCIREKSIDVSCLMSWGMVAGINGILDSVMLIDRAVNQGFPTFSLHASFLMNLLCLLLIMGPMSEISVAYCVYQVYKEGTGETGPSVTSDSLYGALPTTGNTPNGQRSGAQTQSFQPFQGKGNVLGAQNV